jgi:hypothetical protein
MVGVQFRKSRKNALKGAMVWGGRKPEIQANVRHSNFRFRVTALIYLGTLISNDNSVQKEIQRRILASSRTYFAAINLFRNRLLSRATKIRLYKTLMRPVVTFGAETWTMTNK